MLAVSHDSNEDAGAERQAELVKALDNNPGLLLIAEVAGQVIGVILGTTDGHWGYPKRLIVAPTHRRQGVGRALITGRQSHRSVASGILPRSRRKDFHASFSVMPFASRPYREVAPPAPGSADGGCLSVIVTAV